MKKIIKKQSIQDGNKIVEIFDTNNKLIKKITYCGNTNTVFYTECFK